MPDEVPPPDDDEDAETAHDDPCGDTECGETVEDDGEWD